MRFEHPFRLIVAGPSNCGKSTWVFRLIEHLDQMCPEIERVVYCYNSFQEAFDRIKGVEFHEGLDILDELKLEKRACLLICDDFMNHPKLNEICEFFTRHSHHSATSVVFITQNFFNKSKSTRDLSLSASHVSFFKSPRDMGQIYALARQMYPRNSNFMIESYQDATTSPHGYLFLDLSQQANENRRLTTKIFPGEKTVADVKIQE